MFGWMKNKGNEGKIREKYLFGCPGEDKGKRENVFYIFILLNYIRIRM